MSGTVLVPCIHSQRAWIMWPREEKIGAEQFCCLKESFWHRVPEPMALLLCRQNRRKCVCPAACGVHGKISWIWNEALGWVACRGINPSLWKSLKTGASLETGCRMQWSPPEHRHLDSLPSLSLSELQARKECFRVKCLRGTVDLPFLLYDLLT